MSEFEQGFHDATRRIDVMESPVPPLDPAELARLGEVVRRRRSRVRTLLVAAAVALIATVVGLAGMLSGRGQAGPVVGVPVVPPTPVRYVVDPVPAEAMPGNEIVIDDPDTAGGSSPRAFSVDGGRVFLADSKAEEIRVYLDAKLVETIATPSLQILQLLVRDGVYYAIVRRSDTPHDGPIGALKAFTVKAGKLVPADSLPAAGTQLEPGWLVLVGGRPALRGVLGDIAVLTGEQTRAAPSTISYFDESDRVMVEDGLIAAELHTRLNLDSAGLIARDATYAWYEVVTRSDAETYESFVYQFALTGELVATWTSGPTTGSPVAKEAPGTNEYVVDGGQVYRLVDTETGVEVVRLQPRPA